MHYVLIVTWHLSINNQLLFIIFKVFFCARKSVTRSLEDNQLDTNGIFVKKSLKKI